MQASRISKGAGALPRGVINIEARGWAQNAGAAIGQAPHRRRQGGGRIGLTVCAVLLLGMAVWWLAGHPAEPPAEQQMILLRHTADGRSEEMALEDALVGFVAAEMPASWGEAALQAQAVAARSFVMSRYLADGEVCDDIGHCLAYLDEDERRQRWGLHYAANESRIRAAVAATSGEVLSAEGGLVPGYFHASCGGTTESSAVAWGGEELYPSVECFWDGGAADGAARFFPREELAEVLGVDAAALPLLHITAHSASGRVREVTCGSRHWSGSEFRGLLGLASTNFNWLSAAEGYLFNVWGYGHGVGMCQQGAEGMAAAGYDYRAILQAYYSGCGIDSLSAVLP